MILGETALHKVPCASDGLEVSHRDDRGLRQINRTSSFAPDIAIKFLLDRGANINAKNDSGQTALHLSAMYEEDLAMAVLIQNGSDISSTDNKGNTALHAATSAEHFRGSGRPGEVAIPASIFHWNEKGMMLLLDHVAQVNAKNTHGRTPLHLASEDRNEGLAKILLNHRADIDAVDRRHWTALHLAAWNQSMPVILLLLRHGATITMKASHGSKSMTAFEMARCRSHT
jgi:ankyrin repeat protein